MKSYLIGLTSVVLTVAVVVLFIYIVISPIPGPNKDYKRKLYREHCERVIERCSGDFNPCWESFKRCIKSASQ